MQTDISIANKINYNKVLWEKGDFTRIAQTMRESGDARNRNAQDTGHSR